MEFFYIYLGIAIAIAIAFLLYPWLKAANSTKVAQGLSNVTVIRQRIEEIKQEAKEGLIDHSEVQNAIDEMKLALLSESVFDGSVDSNSQNTTERTTQTSKGVSSAVYPLIVGMLVALGTGVYVYIEANQAKGLSQLLEAKNNISDLSERIVVSPASDVSPQEFDQYALVIRQKLREQADDAIGWQWLGRLRMTLGQLEESSAAFEKALRLRPDDQATRVKYAQTLMMEASEDSLANAMRQMRYLVSVSPDEPEYRLLLTVIAAQVGDTHTAFDNFALIKDALSPDSTFYASLVSQLRAMGAPDAVLLRNEVPESLSVANRGENTSEALPSFEITITLADTLRAKLPKDAYLIVFAQDANSDSRMPLAVKKQALSSFPLQVQLSTGDAMLPSLSLANAQQVRLTARISIDENVMPASGELQGVLPSVDIDTQATKSVLIEINEELKLDANN